jgi:hypothetical protein
MGLLPIAHLWLLAVIPIGFAIMPVSELMIVLLLVLAADVAVWFLLGENLRALAERRAIAVPVGPVPKARLLRRADAGLTLLQGALL